MGLAVPPWSFFLNKSNELKYIYQLMIDCGESCTVLLNRSLLKWTFFNHDPNYVVDFRRKKHLRDTYKRIHEFVDTDPDEEDDSDELPIDDDGQDNQDRENGSDGTIGETGGAQQ
jgi:hypothetical protein